MFDDELPIKKIGGDFPRNLETLSVTELENYITELESEIARVRKNISQKKKSQDAAASVFKF